MNEHESRSLADDDPYPYDDEDDRYGRPWCKDFEGHKAAHEFCDDHQSMWCRLCDRQCPDCEDDPHCRYCHCSLFTEDHDWDCAYAGDSEEDEHEG